MNKKYVVSHFFLKAILSILLVTFNLSLSYAGGPEPDGPRPYKKTKISGVMTLKQNPDDDYSISIYLVGKCNKKQEVEFKYINKYLCGSDGCDQYSDFTIPECPFILGEGQFGKINADKLMSFEFPTDRVPGCFEPDDGLGGGDASSETLVITDVKEFINVDNTITAVVDIRALD
jgi:hypothetical protein